MHEICWDLLVTLTVLKISPFSLCMITLYSFLLRTQDNFFSLIILKVHLFFFGVSSDHCNRAVSGEKHPVTGNLLDTHLEVILANVRLNYLLERDASGWDAKLNWEDILSLGEQQRLGMVCELNQSQFSSNLVKFLQQFFNIVIKPPSQSLKVKTCSIVFFCLNFNIYLMFCKARLFFHKPKVGILDECTKYVSSLTFL